jgi:hypothetical protein
MKRALFSLLLVAGVIFFLTGCVTTAIIHHSNVAPLVSFNKPGKQPYMEKIPIKIGLRLSNEFKTRMPLAQQDPEIWIWFLMEGLKPVFEDVVIVEQALEPQMRSSFDLVLKPELWHWWFLSDHAALGLKIRFINKYGSEQFSMIAEGRSMKNIIGHWENPKQEYARKEAESRERALAQAMDQMMMKLQYMIIQKKEEILSISQKTHNK